MAMNRIEKACQKKGMRMTEQRRVIAQVIADSDDHPDVEELYKRAVQVDAGISIADTPPDEGVKDPPAKGHLDRLAPSRPVRSRDRRVVRYDRTRLAPPAQTAETRQLPTDAPSHSRP